MPDARGYDDRISSLQGRGEIFTTHFPHFGRAVENMKYLDIRMPVRLGFIAGSTRLYSSSNREVGTIVADESAVFGKRSECNGSSGLVSDHFQWLDHQKLLGKLH